MHHGIYPAQRINDRHAVPEAFIKPISTRIVLSLEAAAEAAWRVVDFVTATKRKEQP
jgi:hypothetical protein